MRTTRNHFLIVNNYFLVVEDMQIFTACGGFLLSMDINQWYSFILHPLEFS